MTNKPTKKDNYAELRVLAEKAERTDLVAFVDHEVELLNKKSASKAPTKEQLENESIKNAIVEALGVIGRPVTVTELLANSPAVNTMVKGSNQKASALLRQLYHPDFNDLRVVKVIDKKRSLFALNA